MSFKTKLKGVGDKLDSVEKNSEIIKKTTSAIEKKTTKIL